MCLRCCTDTIWHYFQHPAAQQLGRIFWATNSEAIIMNNKRTIISILLSTALLGACTGTSTSSSSSSSSSSSNSSSSNSSSSSSSSSSTSGGAAGALVVNEVVAKSATADYLAGNDWVELFNSGTTSVNLADYTLADSASAKLPLPSINLAPGQYIVIAAVDDKDTNPPTPSVPFKLGGADAVYLYKNGTLISSLNWPDGAAPEASSYGIVNGTAQTLKPTPGAANALASTTPPAIVRGKPSGSTPLRISEVVPQSDRPTFNNGADWIELVNDSNTAVNLSEFSLTDDANPLEKLPNISVPAGGRIVIVAGGTAPTDGTAFVTFGLGRSDSLSLFRNNQEVDYVAWTDNQSKNGRSYGRLTGNSAWQELYPTPGYENVAYVLFTREKVFTVRVNIDSATFATMVRNKQEVYYPADFELNGAKIANVGFRLKGQGSLNSVPAGSKRFGFKVDMNQYAEQKFMGMKKLVFSQSFADPSFMRDVLAYDLMRQAGMPSPEISFVNLYVAGEHLGLYQMVEAIDTEFLEKNFPDDKDSQGDLHKGELFQRLTLNGTSYNNYKTGLPLKNNSATEGTAQEGAAVVKFIQDINSGNSTLAQSRVDIDLTIKYLAADVLLGNMDNPLGATANNFYLYEQRSKNTFTYLPWDYNLGFALWGNGPTRNIGGGGGGFGGGTTTSTANHPCRIVTHVIDNPVHDTNPARPMLDVVLKNPQLRARYRAELTRLIDNYYNPAAVRSKVNTLAALIDTYVKEDPTKFFTYDEFKLSLEQGLPANSNIAGGRGAGIYGPAQGLVKFVEEKTNNIKQQINGQLPSANSGGTMGACPPGSI